MNNKPINQKAQLFYALLNKTPIAMRMTLLLLFVITFQLQAEHIYSQDAKISLNMRNSTVEKVLQTIEEKSDYYFLYNNRLIDVDRKVSVKVKNASISSVLEKLFNSENVEYEVEGSQIILSPKEMHSQITAVIEAMQQQKKTITGKIIDAAGIPIIGANIVEAGTTNGTVTDIDGNFALQVGDNAVIHISYIGYLEQNITTAGRTTFNITLQEDTQALDELVVIGYGTMRKRDLTGSVSSIKSDDIHRSAVTSFDQAIQGKAAGVQVSQASSAPGGRVMIRVRGGNSLSSSNEPLYIVDGFPISAGESAGGNGTAQNPLATLNTSDIASIEILKDASATAIYGSRGANGVVLITTKRGETGKPQVTFESYYGVQTVAKRLDMMNAREYATLVNEANANEGKAPIFPNKNNLHYFPDISSLGEGVDYQDLVFTDAPIQNYNVGVTGGVEGIRYSVGGGYFSQDGVIKNSDFNRASFRSNLDINILSNLTLNTNISASHTWASGMPSEGDGGGGGGAVVHGIIIMPASVPVYDAEGNYTQTNPTPGATPSSNPVATVNHHTDKHSIDRVLGSVDLNWEIINNLALKITFGSDMSTANRAFYWPRETQRGNSKNGEGYQNYRKDASYLNENILTYNNVMGDHSLNALVGYTWQIFHYMNASSGSTNYSTDLYQANNLGAGTVYTAPGSNKSQNQLVSYLSRINYIYKDRYLFTLTARADGSSRFGANNKWALFPSLAVAWRISEEEFLKDISWLSNLKTRVSYGKTGNQNIANYRSLAMLGTMNYPFGGSLNSGVGPNNIPNPDLKWETTATTDIGLDVGLFNNRVSLVADYYYKKTTDLLWNISTPSTSGFTSIFKNIGSLENKGVEISIGADIFTGEFKWNSQLNWSRNRNKVLEIPGYTPSTQGSLSGHLKVNGSWLEPGLPVGVWNLLKYDGVFQDQAQLDAGPRNTKSGDRLGDARYVDKSGDGFINVTDDRMIVGDPNPDFIYGWTNNFSFKGFDLSVYLQGSQGNDIINIQRAETNVSGPWGNQRREILNRWTPENTNTNIPRARVTVDPLLIQSDWLIEDGSYMRIKTISLGYTFKNLLAINSLRVYLTGQNLFTFTDYSGFDPEVNAQGNSNLQLGVDYNAYPAAKTILFGINASF